MEYRQRTSDGLRRAALKGIRPDKNARDVTQQSCTDAVGGHLTDTGGKWSGLSDTEEVGGSSPSSAHTAKAAPVKAIRVFPSADPVRLNRVVQSNYSQSEPEGLLRIGRPACAVSATKRPQEDQSRFPCQTALGHDLPPRPHILAADALARSSRAGPIITWTWWVRPSSTSGTVKGSTVSPSSVALAMPRLRGSGFSTRIS